MLSNGEKIDNVTRVNRNQKEMADQRQRTASRRVRTSVTFEL